MPNDNVDLRFTAELNADPAVREANKASAEIAKALSKAINPDNSGLMQMRKNLEGLQQSTSALLKEMARKSAVYTPTKEYENLKAKIQEAHDALKSLQKGSKKYKEVQKRLTSLQAEATNLERAGKDKVLDKFDFSKITDGVKLYVDLERQAGELAKQINAETSQIASAEQITANSADEVNGKLAEGKESADAQTEAFKNAGKEIDKNTAKQKKFNEESRKAPEKAEASTDKLKKDVEKKPIQVNLNADVAKMNIAELTQYVVLLQQKMKEIKSQWAQGISSDALNQDFTKASAQMERAKIKINEYKASFKSIEPVARDTMSKVSGWVNVASQAIGLLQKAVNGPVRDFKRLLNVVRSVMKKIVSVVKSAASVISRALRGGLTSLSDSADKIFSVRNLKRAFNMLIKYTFGVRSLFFLYRKIRKLVGEGLENLVQFESASNETNHAITELRTSLLFLKNAWAAAFAPIINVVYPILVTLMDMLARVGNMIARFVAALTGQATVLQALKVDAGDYAESLKSAGGSAGKAAKAQEELNDRLAAFDDLNVLGVDDDKDKSPSGGGGGGADDLLPSIDDMFERINTPFNALAQKLRDAWESGDFFEVGVLIGESISKGLDKAYSWLTGEGRAEMERKAQSIGSFIDGLLSVESLGAQFGRTIGEAFVLAMDFVNEIITPDRMYKVGVQIANAFNEAIPRILPKLGETIGNLFRSAIAQVWGFLSTADFASWGDSFATAINNFIDEMSKELVVASKGVKPGERTEIIENLTGWSMLGQSVTRFATGVLDFIRAVLQNVNWHDVGRAIGEFLSSIEWSDIADGLGDTWKALNEAFSGLWEGLSEDEGLASKLEPIAKIVDTLGTSLERIIDHIDPETLERWLKAIPEWIETITDVTIALWDILEPFFTFMVEHPDLVVTLVAIGEALKIIAGVLATVGTVANIITAVQALAGAGTAVAGAGVAASAVGTAVAAGAGAGAVSTALIPAVSSAGATAGAAMGEATVAGFLPAVSSAEGAIEGAMTETLVGAGSTAGAEAAGALGTSFSTTAGAVGAWSVAVAGIATAAHEAYGAGEAIGYMVDNAEDFENLNIGPLNAIAGGLRDIGDNFAEGASAIGQTFTDSGFVEGMGVVRDGFLDMIGVGDLTGASDRLTAWGETAQYVASDTAEAYYLASHDMDTAVTDMTSSAEESTGIVEALSQKTAHFVTDTINSGYRDMANYYANIGQDATNAFEPFKNSAKDAIDKTAESLDSVPEKFETIKGTVDTKSVEMSNKFTTAFDSIKQGSADGAKMMSDNFTLAFTNIETAFVSTWESIKKSLQTGGDMFTAITEGVNITFKSLLNSLIAGLNQMLITPLSQLFTSMNTLRNLDVGGNRPFASIPYLKAVQIPYLAQGAVIPPNREFMAILGDQSNGTNIEAPLDTIKAAVGDELAPYLEELIAINRQVINAINNKPVINYRDIGKGYTTYTNEQKMMKGSML